VPYRATRYYLKEQRLLGKRPENSKELFNLRHASLRNVIERIFGVVKRKYQILKTPSEYSLDTQIRIVIACTALHNWVRNKEGERADFWLETEAERNISNIQPAVVYPEGSTTSRRMDIFRDQIAETMWVDYQRYLQSTEQ
jgi:DDE superfamily endonuclease